jgi:hypothetical protein
LRCTANGFVLLLKYYILSKIVKNHSLTRSGAIMSFKKLPPTTPTAQPTSDQTLDTSKTTPPSVPRGVGSPFQGPVGRVSVESTPGRAAAPVAFAEAAPTTAASASGPPASANTVDLIKSQIISLLNIIKLSRASKDVQTQAKARKEFIELARIQLGEATFKRAKNKAGKIAQEDLEDAATKKVTLDLKIELNEDFEFDTPAAKEAQRIAFMELSETPDANYGTARERKEARELQEILERKLKVFLMTPSGSTD